MNPGRPKTARKRRDSGYALLMVIFLVTLLLISTMAIAPNILTEGRREKEKEMIWRGKQYTRGVKLYYRKLGAFPLRSTISPSRRSVPSALCARLTKIP